MDVVSRLEAVTVYARGAVCTRVGEVTLPPGSGDTALRFVGLPLSLVPGSLRARVASGPPGARVLDVRPGYETRQGEAINVPEEQRAMEAAEEQVQKLQRVHAGLEHQLQELAALRPTFPTPPRGAPPRPAPVEAILALGSFTESAMAELHDARRAHQKKLDEANAELRLHRQRLSEASSAQRTEQVQVFRTAELRLSDATLNAPITIAVEYLVLGARWLPSYELRLARSMDSGALWMRASVAQSTGEDWAAVRLSLSTADLDRRTELPALRALRIGRAQPPPPRSGWREPPAGLSELFGDYEAFAGRATAPKQVQPLVSAPPPPAPPPPQPPEDLMADEDEPAADEGPSREEAFGGRARAGAPPPASRRAAPSAAPSLARAPSLGGASNKVAMLERSMVNESMEEPSALFDDGAEAEGGAGERGPEGLAGPAQALLDYGRLTLVGAQAPERRGQLQPAGELELLSVSLVAVQVAAITVSVRTREEQAQRLLALPSPSHCAPPRESAGSYDYQYACSAPVEVASTGGWHAVPVMACEVGLSPAFACVPAVDPAVYRTLTLTNRGPHALLRGPCDVSLDEGFLLTTQLPTVAPGANTELGLGVEEAIKVARKTAFKETSGGLLGGSTVLPHELEIQIANRLGAAAAVEVRERIPITFDTDVKIEEAQVKPPWTKDEGPREGQLLRGGRSWRVTVPAGQVLTLSAQFTIKMPSDRMLVGGNRRA